MINKIVDADKVIHVQQLGIPWQPPSNPIFGFAEAKAAGGGS
jgi:dynein regulatory complex protein 1